MTIGCLPRLIKIADQRCWLPGRHGSMQLLGPPMTTLIYNKIIVCQLEFLLADNGCWDAIQQGSHTLLLKFMGNISFQSRKKPIFEAADRIRLAETRATLISQKKPSLHANYFDHNNVKFVDVRRIGQPVRLSPVRVSVSPEIRTHSAYIPRKSQPTPLNLFDTFKPSDLS